MVKLYDQKNSTTTVKKSVDEEINEYSDLQFEEFITLPINRIRFKYSKNLNFDYGFSTARQSWYSSDNVITECCSDVSELVTSYNDNKGNNYIFHDLYYT